MMKSVFEVKFLIAFISIWVIICCEQQGVVELEQWAKT
jgi:hypothetical protein